jgi:hypothetical protein
MYVRYKTGLFYLNVAYFGQKFTRITPKVPQKVSFYTQYEQKVRPGNRPHPFKMSLNFAQDFVDLLALQVVRLALQVVRLALLLIEEAILFGFLQEKKKLFSLTHLGPML